MVAITIGKPEVTVLTEHAVVYHMHVVGRVKAPLGNFFAMAGHTLGHARCSQLIAHLFMAASTIYGESHRISLPRRIGVPGQFEIHVSKLASDVATAASGGPTFIGTC